MNDRPASPEWLAALHALCFTTPRPWTDAEFRQFLDSPNVFLVHNENGFLLGRIAGPEAELLTLAVAPDARRKGVARELLSLFEKTTLDRGADSAFLEVSQENHAAISLYRSAGYTPLGHRRDYYQGPRGKKISAIVMFRKLSNNEGA